MYTTKMKYDWNPEKNEWLKKERKVSFEDVVFHLSQGDVWKVADHPDQQRYPEQKIYFVIIEDYIYLVPHILKKEYIFLFQAGCRACFSETVPAEEPKNSA